MPDSSATKSGSAIGASAVPRHALIEAAAIAAGMLVLFWPFLTNHVLFSLDPDWSYAFLVPVVSLYYLWMRRDEILAVPVRPTLVGLLLAAAGVAVYVHYTLGHARNHTLQGVGFVVTLLGVTLTMLGPGLWRRTLFAQLYLLLAIKLSPQVLLRVTPVLQRWAAIGSEHLLGLLGYDIQRAGNVLTVIDEGELVTLNVAEACSGMRMIVAFIALGVAVAFLARRAWWQRVLLVAFCIPVAIVVNVLRVATIGIMATFDRSWASGDAHVFLGTVWLVPAVAIYLGLAWIVEHLVIVDEGAPAASDGGPADASSTRNRLRGPGGAA